MTHPRRFSSYAVALTAFVYGLSFWRFPVRDPDLGWHLLGGAWMWHHHTVPSQDFINSFNYYWHDYHWLSQLFLYSIFRVGGYTLLRLCFALLMAGTGVLLVAIIERSSARRPSGPLTLALFFGAATLISEVFAVRPQIIALVFIALTVHRLLRPPGAWELPYLFVLTVLLVNIHVYWVVIPFLWFLSRCLPRLYRSHAPSAAYAWGGLALLAASGFISPYGAIPSSATPPSVAMNYAVLWDYATMPAALRANIREFRSGLAVPGPTPWLILAYLVVFARTFKVRRFLADAGQGLGAVIFLLLTIGSIKFVSIFAVTSLPYFAKHAGRALRVGLRSQPPAFASRVAAVSLVASLMVAAWSSRRINDSARDIGMEFPVAACRRIAGLGLSPVPPRDHLRVLTPFSDGGWCRWTLYQERPDLDFRVTTDGRTQGVPVQRYLDAYDVYMVRNNWLETLQRWSPDVLLVPKSFPLANVLLLAAPSFQLVFQDDSCAVFVPAQKPAGAPGTAS
ncbi:MAG: hypothetical protein ACHQ4J_12480 [Candidatus Binatia bacterium]